MSIYYSPLFVARYKKISKKNKKQGNLIKEKIALFLSNKTHSSLRLHKLQGNLKEAWSISVDRKIRILLYQDTNSISFVDIGSHDEVYR